MELIIEPFSQWTDTKELNNFDFTQRSCESLHDGFYSNYTKILLEEVMQFPEIVSMKINHYANVFVKEFVQVYKMNCTKLCSKDLCKFA